MSAPDRIWLGGQRGFGEWRPAKLTDNDTQYLRADGPTITAYREALRLLGADPDSIAREAEKEAQNGA